jgi:hypothetical protein
LVAVLAAAALPGCGGGSGDRPGPPFTTRTIQTGFVKPADLGKNVVTFEDDGHVGGHVIFTPEDSVPTCPYAQRADDIKVAVQPAVELVGGDWTKRLVVAPPNPDASRLPVVTQGAVVFKSTQLAVDGMKKVSAEIEKCPRSFTILGGPPEIIGTFTINSRPFSESGWTGYAQQLAHTSPRDVNATVYDDLETIVVRKANAILYAGFALVKKVGERANSAQVAQDMLKRTLARLG